MQREEGQRERWIWHKISVIKYHIHSLSKKKSYPLERFVVHIVHICRFFFNYIMIFSVLIYRIFSLALKNHIKVCGLAQKIVGP